MITETEYLKRVEENTKEYLNQLSTGSFDLLKFHGCDAVAGEVGRWMLSTKTHDILSAILVKSLPVLKMKSGIDAYKLEHDGLRPIELKSSVTDQSKLFRTFSNSIFSTKPENIINGSVHKNKTTSFKSNFNASYDIKNDLDSKNLDTYLIVADSVTDQPVDVYKMSGRQVVNLLESRSTGKVTIKFSTFEKYGTQVTDTIIPIQGIDNWGRKMLPNLDIVDRFG